MGNVISFRSNATSHLYSSIDDEDTELFELPPDTSSGSKRGRLCQDFVPEKSKLLGYSPLSRFELYLHDQNSSDMALLPEKATICTTDSLSSASSIVFDSTDYVVSGAHCGLVRDTILSLAAENERLSSESDNTKTSNTNLSQDLHECRRSLNEERAGGYILQQKNELLEKESLETSYWNDKLEQELANMTTQINSLVDHNKSLSSSLGMARDSLGECSKKNEQLEVVDSVRLQAALTLANSIKMYKERAKKAPSVLVPDMEKVSQYNHSNFLEEMSKTEELESLIQQVVLMLRLSLKYFNICNIHVVYAILIIIFIFYFFIFNLIL